MEGTPHFGCWCKLCMLNEWLVLEAEINLLVFGRHDSYYTMVPSPAPTRCTLTNSPIASTTTSPLGTKSISPNEEAFRAEEHGATTQRAAGLNAFSNPNMFSPNEKCFHSTGFNPQKAEVISSKRETQLGCRFLPRPRGLRNPNICTPPRSTAKRQKKTPADLERADPPRSRRLHVSNIPFWFEDHHLVKIFQDVGDVIQAEVIYNERGSKGFGFVTFENENQATNIRTLFNGSELHGRVIEVNYASKRQGSKSRAQPQKECAQPAGSTNENPRNDKALPCRRCEPPYSAAGKPYGAGAWPPQHRQNVSRISRMPPACGWLQHHRRKLGPHL